MRPTCLSLIFASVTPVLGMADVLACRGENPFWYLDIDTAANKAVFERTGEAEQLADIALTALAQGDSSIRAYSLINTQTGFSGIAVAAPSACTLNGDDSFSHRIEFLTQFQSEAILMTGCCQAQRSE